MAEARTYADFFKVFGDFKPPFVDVNTIIATQRRNMEAFSSANQLITEGVQAVTRRQAEIMRTNIEEAVRASKDIMSGGTPEAGIAKQTQYAKSLVENTINNVREVSEMVTKSNMEAFDLLNKRMLESIEEFSSAAATATAAAAPRK